MQPQRLTELEETAQTNTMPGEETEKQYQIVQYCANKTAETRKHEADTDKEARTAVAKAESKARQAEADSKARQAEADSRARQAEARARQAEAESRAREAEASAKQCEEERKKREVELKLYESMRLREIEINNTGEISEQEHAVNM